jgi:predicted Co/Zn/Cd cation transporter (cation efflux family)
MANNKFENVKNVPWAILIANVAVALIKIIVGTMIKSLSLTADGFHSIAARNIKGPTSLHTQHALCWFDRNN